MNNSNSDDFFWDLIDKYKNLSNEDFYESLSNELSKMPDQDIYLFEIELTKKLNKMHTWQTLSFMLVAEGSSIYGDAYFYCCYGVVKQGKDFYEKFIDNPENVVENIVKLWEKKQSIWNSSFHSLSVNAMMIKYNIKDGLSQLPFEHPGEYAHRLGYKLLIESDPLEEGEMSTFMEATERFPKFYAAWQKETYKN